MTTRAMVLVLAAVAVCGAERTFSATSDANGSESLQIGEVRAIAVARANQEAVAQLHRRGWLEANGQLLLSADFAELYRQIGRTWTADEVVAQYFALPDLHKGIQSSSNQPTNPGGVLGPGDLLQSGRPQRMWERAGVVSYWIFVGRDVSQLPVIRLK